jgi:hypothetical protein|tara:strand:- start:2295 stop:2912 length:618 start_codon:yes stop_codon:yes gene_type:complete
MAQTLLIEYSVFTPKNTQITEGISGNKNMIVNGVVQRAEEFNHNGRRYPFEILKREVDKYIEGPIRENRALGELDHPESSVINLKNASHNIKELYFEGNDLMGSIEILPTPSGNILKELFKNNITVGISSRGMGSVKPLGEGKVEVEDDFELLCWDFVSTPSTHGAFVKPVGLNEGRNHNSNPYIKLNKIISDIICTQSGICCLK